MKNLQKKFKIKINTKMPKSLMKRKEMRTAMMMKKKMMMRTLRKLRMKTIMMNQIILRPSNNIHSSK